MVIYNGTNVTGWNYLIDNGSLIGAAYAMYNDAAVFGGWFICILFFVYHLMLLIKTKSLSLAVITGLFFTSLYAVSEFVKVESVYFIFLILAFELGGILYMWIWK